MTTLIKDFNQRLPASTIHFHNFISLRQAIQFMYCIIDIETTGDGIHGNKITEISIFKFDGQAIVAEYTTLVNPECEVPFFITRLTGIDDNMVRNAPKWVEIAPKVDEITWDTIFVAHNVNFDYNVIKHEFQNIGISFSRKKLCTVRLSRKLVPGLHSYSLGKLCTALNIPLTDRHRARGDAQATVLLFQKLLGTAGSEEVFKTFLNARSQEGTLPPSLPKETFEALPNAPGIYYFKDNRGEIIYIGKALDIRKRVLAHFYHKGHKEILICKETHDIDFELSGNELIALLMESAAIKRHYPKYNSSQKRSGQEFAIFSYEDRSGIMHLAYNTLKSVPDPLLTFSTITECRAYLEETCRAYRLCPKFCHLHDLPACSPFTKGNCDGACRGEETPSAYNKRVNLALQNITETHQSYLISEKGRSSQEKAFILVAQGQYRGFGFVDQDTTLDTLPGLESYLELQKENMDTKRILAWYLRKFPDKRLPLPF